MEAREDAGTAGAADGGRAEIVEEAGAGSGDAVNVGGFQDGVAGATEEVAALVIGEEKEDVGPRRGGKKATEKGAAAHGNSI
jgi:hypothetical protein